MSLEGGRPGKDAWTTLAFFLVAAMPLCVVLGPGAADTALSLVVILFLVRSWRSGRWAWAGERWFQVAMLVWLWLFVSSITAMDRGAAFGRALWWFRFPVYAAALAYWLLDRGRLRRIVAFDALVMGVVALDAIYQYFTGVDLFGFEKQGYRLTGPMHRLAVGILLTKLGWIAGLPIARWGFERGDTRVKVAVAAWLLAVTTAVVLSGERMALVLMILGAFIAASTLDTKARKAAIAVLLVAILAIALALAGKGDLYERYVRQTQESITDLWASVYGQLWRNALVIAEHHPVTGVGPKNFRIACHDDTIAIGAENLGRCGTHPHNLYLEWLVETGVVGLIGFLVLLGLWLRRIYLHRRLSKDWWLTSGAAVSVLLQVWPLGPTGSLFNNWNGSMFWFALGIALHAGARDVNAGKVRG